MYELFIFDLDGTLVDSVGDIADALNGALAAVGRAARSDAEVSGMVGAGVDQLVRRGLGVSDGALLTGAEAAEHAQVAAEFRARYGETPVARTGLYLGVRETLRALPGEKAIATNKPGGLSRRIVEKLGIAGEFVAVLGEDDVGVRKPDPLVVDLLRGRVGAARARTLYVGDSRTDAATAEAARVDLALVTYGYETPEVLESLPAKYKLPRFADLLKISRG